MRHHAPRPFDTQMAERIAVTILLLLGVPVVVVIMAVSVRLFRWIA